MADDNIWDDAKNLWDDAKKLWENATDPYGGDYDEPDPQPLDPMSPSDIKNAGIGIVNGLGGFIGMVTGNKYEPIIATEQDTGNQVAQTGTTPKPVVNNTDRSSPDAGSTVPSDPATAATGSPTGTTDTNNAKPNNEQQPQKPKVSKEEQQKRANALSKAYTTSDFFNVRYSQLDDCYDDNEHFLPMKSGKIMRVICYIAPKVNIDIEKRFSPDITKSLAVPLILGSGVDAVVLNDRLDQFGMNGYIQLNDSYSYLDIYLTRYHNFYLVINISQKTKDGIVCYEPYVLDITKVQQIQKKESNGKKMRITFVDCMTSVMKSHSIASVIKFNRNITKQTSYKNVFQIILQYIKSYLKTNSNILCEYRKDVLYGANVLLRGKPANGNDIGNVMDSLVANSFAKMSRNASIYDAVNQLIYDCCTSLKLPKKFTDGYESIGDVLVPFYFKEQYPDEIGIYHKLWIDSEKVTENDSKKNNADDKNRNADGQTYANDQSGTVVQSGTVTNPTTPPATDTPPSTDTPVETPTPTPTDTQTQGVKPVEDPSKPTTTEGTGSTLTDAANGKKNPTQSGSGTTDSGDATGTATTAGANSGGANAVAQSVAKDINEIIYQTTKTGKTVLMRQMTMRDFYMPFCLAFSDNSQLEKGIIFEIYNPNNADKHDYAAINGVYSNKALTEMVYTPMAVHTVNDKWKNVVFIDCSTNSNGGNSTLIFFNWFYEYYCQVFLNSNKKRYVLNVSPDFYTVSTRHKIGHANQLEDSFNSLYDEYNSYTYATETDDTVNECLRHMGKNIASFILLNDLYSFTIDGNMMRRPNEIVRLGVDVSNDGTKNMNEIATDLMRNPFVMLYIREVTHIFTPTTYENRVDCCKICEYR